jgi:hypothetical protein
MAIQPRENGENGEEEAIANAKLSAANVGGDLMQEGPRDYGFLMSEATSYRTRDTITLVQSDVPWLPGDFVTAAGAKATAPGSIAGINCRNMNTTVGARSATVITREAEVADAFLMYGEMDPAAVATALAVKQIIVRQAVLPNVMGGDFDPNKSGPPQSGIKPATVGASWTPDTLEAADPKEKADDHGRVSAANVAANAERQPQAHPPAAPASPAAPHRPPRPPRQEE